MRHDPTLQQLTAKQRKAVEALLTTGEVSAAAREAGVHRDTLHRWLKQPLFVQAVREAEASAVDDLSRLLVQLGRTAAATLATAMGDAATPPATRVRAADAVLGRLLQLRELATLEARVAELEPSRHVAYEATAPGGTQLAMKQTVVPTDGGCRVELELDYELPGGFLGELADRAYLERRNEREAEHSLHNLKDLLEGRTIGRGSRAEALRGRP